MKTTFWNRTSKIYDRFMRKDHEAHKLGKMMKDEKLRFDRTCHVLYSKQNE